MSEMVGWNAGCAERCLSGVGRARRKPTVARQHGAFVLLHSNVHPDHYQTAGRSRPGEDIVQEIETQKYAQSRQDVTIHAPAAPKLPRKARQRRPSGKHKEAGQHETTEESMP
jgi:hypothetical protein